MMLNSVLEVSVALICVSIAQNVGVAIGRRQREREIYEELWRILEQPKQLPPEESIQ